MSSIDGVRGIADALAALLSGIEGVRIERRPGGSPAPPAIYVPPGSMTWDGYVTAPTEASFELVLAVAADERALEALYDLLPQVTETIDGSSVDAVVKSAEPGVWRVGAVELPAYFITVEAAI